MTEYERYEHHGATVWVRSDLKGTHRDNCLCYACDKFNPGSDEHCPIADALYRICIEHDLVTPVYECPEFSRG